MAEGGMTEFELIGRLRAAAGGPRPGGRLRVGIGDDAAVSEPGGATATSTDSVVDGVHFRSEWASPADVAQIAIASALSDLAAMGAAPGEVYVALGVPPGTGDRRLAALTDAVIALAADFEVQLAGGDVVASPVLALTVTVVGHAASADELVTRAGAKKGDILLLTGEVGGAAAGLRLLEDPALAERLEPETAEALRRRQLAPVPRLQAGLALARAGARAMIDLSDGLGADAGHLSAASGHGLRIEADCVPVQDGVAYVAQARGVEPSVFAFGGGEDYELLAAVPADRVEEAEEAVRATGTRVCRIGWVAGCEGVRIEQPGGRLVEPSGHDQLA